MKLMKQIIIMHVWCVGGGGGHGGEHGEGGIEQNPDFRNGVIRVWST